MADRSPIEWTEATWNPVVGCSIVSLGCTNCYAMKMADRIESMIMAHMGQHGGNPGPMFHYEGTTTRGEIGTKPPVWTGKVALAPDGILLAPLRWKRPRRIFVNSMGDLFHESVPDAWIDMVFAIMALCPQHTFQVLTKRSARMRAYMAGHESKLPYLGRMPLERIHVAAAGHMQGEGGIMDALKEAGNVYSLYLDAPWPLPNVWLGVSAEDQRRADQRVPDLLATPAAVRFVSAEPLLGPVDLTAIRCPNGCTPPDYCNRCYPDGGRPTGSFNAFGGGTIDWMIVGGESGHGARPMHVDWVRGLRDQCAFASVPFFFKQWGEWAFEGQTAYQPKEAFFNAAGEPVDEKPPFGPSTGARWHWWEPNHLASYRVGKRNAGRLLDGVEHNGMPQVAVAVVVARLAGAA